MDNSKIHITRSGFHITYSDLISHPPESERGVWNLEHGVWILELSIHHAPDFQLSRYGMPCCVIQIPYLSLVKYGNISLGQQCFFKPYTTRAFFKPYTTGAAPWWCMVSKTPLWCMVSKNTATLKRYFHISLLKCVVSTKMYKKFRNVRAKGSIKVHG